MGKEPTAIPFQQAAEAVQEYCRVLAPTHRESVALGAAVRRVLAESIFADRDFPPFPRATRDGFALRAADLKTIPAVLRVIGQIKAGAEWKGGVGSGDAVEIMTGAAVPPGADAVVMVEHTEQAADRVKILRTVGVGENIVPQGSEAPAGREILSAGTRLGFAQIAVAAAVGKARLSVYKKPRVAILATGDELVEVAR